MRQRWDRFLHFFTTSRAMLLFLIMGTIMVGCFSYVVIENRLNIQQIQQERQDRQTSVNQAVCAIINSIPSGIYDGIDQSRIDFKCPDYKGPQYFPPSPTSSSSR